MFKHRLQLKILNVAIRPKYESAAGSGNDSTFIFIIYTNWKLIMADRYLVVHVSHDHGELCMV